MEKFLVVFIPVCIEILLQIQKNKEKTVIKYSFLQRIIIIGHLCLGIILITQLDLIISSIGFLVILYASIRFKPKYLFASLKNNGSKMMLYNPLDKKSISFNEKEIEHISKDTFQNTRIKLKSKKNIILPNLWGEIKR